MRDTQQLKEANAMHDHCHGGDIIMDQNVAVQQCKHISGHDHGDGTNIAANIPTENKRDGKKKKNLGKKSPKKNNQPNNCYCTKILLK